MSDQLNLEALSLPVRVREDNYVVVDLSDGSILSVPTPPSSDHDSVFCRNAVAEALEALDYLEAARRTVEGDKSLSVIGKTEKLAGLRQQTAALVDKAAAAVAEYEVTSAAYEARVYAPAPIDRGDAVTVAEDIELRGMLRAMPSNERVEMLENIVGQPRMMEAILRSPVAIPVLTEAVQRPWREHISASHPEAGKVAMSRAAAAWAAHVLPQVQIAVGSTTAPRINRAPEPESRLGALAA